MAFLAQTFGGNMEVIDFMQRLIGYCLTGCTAEIAFYIMYGETGTAKSTWVRLLHEILGDYAVAIPGRVLLAKTLGQKDYDTHALAGARLASGGVSPLWKLGQCTASPSLIVQYTRATSRRLMPSTKTARPTWT